MNSKRVIPIIAIVAILALLIYWLQSGSKRFSWRETYQEKSDQPYGTQVILALLKTYFPDEDFTVVADSLAKVLPGPETTDGNFVFIGEGLYLDSLDVQTLLAFVGNGNRAFISSRTIPYDLMFYLYYEECDGYYWDDYYEVADSSGRLNFFHPDLQTDTGFVYQFLRRNELRPYRWQYVGSEYFCDNENEWQALGYLNDELINFVRVPYGDGFFYLHTTPLAFTNIQLLDRARLEYANRVFAHLQEGPVYWDAYSRISEGVARRRNEQAGAGNRTIPSESPLRYILDQPALAWAWYTLLAAGLLYLLFRARRRQRIIPVKEPNTNTSLEFVSTIGRLYFLQNNHRQLALQQTRLLKGFIRDHYQMATRDTDDDFRERLATKSEVPQAVIDKIFLLDRNIQHSNFITENTLIELHQEIDRFYRTCK